MLLLNIKQRSVRQLYKLPSSPHHCNDSIVQRKRVIYNNRRVRLRSLKFVAPTAEL